MSTKEPFREFLDGMAQLRPQGDPGGRMYDPARDVAHLCGPLLAAACGRLDEDSDAVLLRQTLGIADIDLMAAVQAAVDFIHLDLPERLDEKWEPESFEQHLEASKLREVNMFARMLVLSAFGEMALMAGWQAKRAATLYGKDGRLVTKVDSGEEAAEAAARLATRLLRKRDLKERISRIGRAVLREVSA